MRIFVLIIAITMLTGCQSIKEKSSAMSDFFKAIGSGDTSVLKKYKKNKEADNSWEELDNE
tara:strand:- start:29336 stop:29518 length:183 start_codon:yes stop_codon:yes gene_type:complete